MLLPGRIELTTLGDLLGALYRERVSGALELVEPNGATHRVHFRQGVVSGVETALSCPPLGRVLLDMGALSADARRALDRFAVARSGTPIGAQLVDGAYIDGETLTQALREQLQRRLDALGGIERARISFRPRAHGTTDPVDLTPREFLHGRPRKRAATVHHAGPVRVSGRAEALAALGLPKDAGLAEVRAAFRRLAGQMHPDTQSSASAAERQALAERFARASAAYHVLVA